jgi:hypothetical protein
MQKSKEKIATRLALYSPNELARATLFKCMIPFRCAHIMSFGLGFPVQERYSLGGRRGKDSGQIIGQREGADRQVHVMPEGKLVAAERHSWNLRTVVREEPYDAESQPSQ